MVTHGRVFRGYVTSVVTEDLGLNRGFRAMELDMPVPEYLSGAPVLRVDTGEVIGVVYGTSEVSGTSGAITFGRAHHPSVLAEALALTT